MDTPSDDFMSRLKESTQVGSDYATQPGPEGLISQTHEPKVNAKGNSKQEAETRDPNNDFSEENLWPGADSLDRLDSFTSFSPRWQSGSENFVAGAPEYHIPRDSLAPPRNRPSRLVYLLHALTIPSHKSRLIHSDKFMTLRDFTKIIRLGFDQHGSISQITVYLYSRDSDGCPLEWKPIHIMSFTDWDGSMTVGRQWSCKITAVVEFMESNADLAVNTAARPGRGGRAQ